MALASTSFTPCAERTKDVQSCFETFARSKARAWKPSLLRTFCQIHNNIEQKPSKKKVANLKVQQHQILPLPSHSTTAGVPRPLSAFLSQRAGMESMLNVKALQSHEYVGSNVFSKYKNALEDRLTPYTVLRDFGVGPLQRLSTYSGFTHKLAAAILEFSTSISR
ncbi:hypothetical protein L7F22_022250 [Adiantum nelumboides]|nr:hypothetical protein [Adiantum nelumboides]